VEKPGIKLYQRFNTDSTLHASKSKQTLETWASLAS